MGEGGRKTDTVTSHHIDTVWLLRAGMLLEFLKGTDDWRAPGMNGWQVFVGSGQEKDKDGGWAT